MYSSGRLLDSPDPNAAEHGRKLAESAIGVRLEPVVEEDPVPDSDMHIAAAEGDVNALQGLHDAGHPSDVRAADGSTPLHRAAAAGQLGAVKWLSKHYGEAMQNALDTEGRTPLAVAIYHEQLMVARWLNDENRSTRHFKLHWAAQHGHLQVTGLLAALPACSC
jgi:ankyrin repeat protein